MNPTTQDHLVQDIRSENLTAWSAFITAHMGLVYELANDLMATQDQLEELIGEGEVALCQAARDYCDGVFDCRFTTYAYTRIKRAIISYQRTDGGVSTEWMARVSQRARGDNDHLRKILSSLGLDWEPTPDELAYCCSNDEPDEEDVRRYAVRLQGTPRFVPLDTADTCHAFPLQGDEPIDGHFRDSLSPATRHVWSGLLQQVSITGNVSLTLEAQRNDITRDEVQTRVVTALREWAGAHVG